MLGLPVNHPDDLNPGGMASRLRVAMSCRGAACCTLFPVWVAWHRLRGHVLFPQHKVRKLVGWIVFDPLIALLLAGCAIHPPFPKEVNAVAEGIPHSKSLWDPGSQVQRKANPDIIGLLVYTDSVSEFARTRSGKWITYWYLCKFKIMTPVAGDLDENEIAFVCKDAWPTPESGLMIDKVPFPYFKGKIFLFAIKNKNKPYQVLYQEKRSFLAPHGPMNYSGWRSINHEQIFNAIHLYNKSRKAKPSGGRIVEATDQYWIAAVGPYAAPELLMVDRKNMTVKPLPLFQKIERKHIWPKYLPSR
jgi:hypothetical protein